MRELWGQLEPHLQGSAYINHIAADDRPEKVRASFGANHQRLREIKTVYDKAKSVSGEFEHSACVGQLFCNQYVAIRRKPARAMRERGGTGSSGVTLSVSPVAKHMSNHDHLIRLARPC